MSSHISPASNATTIWCRFPPGYLSWSVMIEIKFSGCQCNKVHRKRNVKTFNNICRTMNFRPPFDTPKLQQTLCFNLQLARLVVNTLALPLYSKHLLSNRSLSEISPNNDHGNVECFISQPLCIETATGTCQISHSAAITWAGFGTNEALVPE